MAKSMQNLQTLEPFNVDDNTNLARRWEVYREEVDLFLVASGVTNDLQKRAILLHANWKRVREIFTTLKGTGNSYADACMKLDEYFKPRKNVIYKICIFRNTKQQSDENTASYVVRLRKMADTCDYGSRSAEDIRDHFVCSCHDEKLREKLLRTSSLTVDKILEIGHMYENSKQQAAEISCIDHAKYEVRTIHERRGKSRNYSNRQNQYVQSSSF